jgi:hypothetical protein
MSDERCVFCNSATHTMAKCNSNFNGQRKQIDDLWRFLVQDKCPDFNTYPLNQLRYIAYHFARYEKAIPLKRGSMGHKYNRKYLLNPISLTLSKPRTVRALVERWTGFKSVRDLRSSVPEGDSCPICIETPLTVPKWDLEHSKWDMEYCLADDDDLLIITKCKHLFCGSCWNAHLRSNIRRDHLGEYVACPMCRSRVTCTRNHLATSVDL